MSVKPTDVVYCAHDNSVIVAKDAFWLDGRPYRPEHAPKGAKKLSGETVDVPATDEGHVTEPLPEPKNDNDALPAVVPTSGKSKP